MDSMAKFPDDIRIAISPRKIVQISRKTSRSRDTLHFNHISEQWTMRLCPML